eukprot:1420802-Lingulodinium_polyedra.AAC.1
MGQVHARPRHRDPGPLGASGDPVPAGRAAAPSPGRGAPGPALPLRPDGRGDPRRRHATRARARPHRRVRRPGGGGGRRALEVRRPLGRAVRRTHPGRGARRPGQLRAEGYGGPGEARPGWGGGL